VCEVTRHAFETLPTTETNGYLTPMSDLETEPLRIELLPHAVRARTRIEWKGPLGNESAVIDGSATVGSAPRAQLVVADPLVSRIHCELFVRGDGLWVRDLDSRNGTFVDGVRVECARVDVGHALRLGATELRVVPGQEQRDVDLWPDETFGRLVGRSVAARELFAKLARIAGTSSTVLLRGETGTGKELAARALHDGSPRREGPYVVVDCGAIPEALLESELFGHVKGAFTGATNTRNGAFAEAHGGTLFLDEIGELPLALQPKLLRFLETRTVRRIGESVAREVDVRVVAATHRDLRTMVNSGAFREDLYFRLAVIPVEIPPLRDRLEDLEILVNSFLPAELRGRLFSPAEMSELRRRAWTGNIRELRNFAERAVTLGPRWALSEAARTPSSETFPPVRITEPFKEIRERWLARLEIEYLQRALEHHGGSVQAVADASGLDRSYVYRLILKHGLR
jgi:transcriptional regulator with PAS, ATPase and Fis domain